MGLSGAEELGKALGNLSNNQSDLKETVMGDEIEQSLLLTPIDTIEVETTVVVYKKFYDGESLILDHPLFGQLDNSTLHLDGDYASSVYGAIFPLDFSDNAGAGFAFDESTPGTVLWDTYTG
jgi:hypothetical protein